MAISPTFYEQHLCMNVYAQLFSTYILLYVCFKFVRQEAVGIHYIPWPPKKIAAQISYQVCLPKIAQICAACTANWPKLPKKKLQKKHMVLLAVAMIYIFAL